MRDDASIAIAREIRSLVGPLVAEHGMVACARGLMRAGVKLMARARGKSEASAELRNLLSKASVAARAQRDIDGEPLPDIPLRVLPRADAIRGPEAHNIPSHELQKGFAVRTSPKTPENVGLRCEHQCEQFALDGQEVRTGECDNGK